MFKLHKEITDVYEKIFSITNHQEIQIRTTMRCHLKPVRIAIIWKARNNKHCCRCTEKEILYTTDGSINWCSHYRKYYGVSSKDLKYNYHVMHQLSGYLSEENENINWKRCLHSHVHFGIIYSSQDMGTACAHRWMNR